MSKTVRYRCLNCGLRFESQVLEDDELREMARKNEHYAQISCPNCNRLDVRVGWD